MGSKIVLSTIFLPIIFFVLLTSNNSIKATDAITNTTTTIEKDVSVMYAGSLVNIFENEIKSTFQNLTGYNFLGEGKGSVQISNMILDGFRKPDVFVSADTTPIERLMNHDPSIANWLVKFGSAELVIAYNPKSPFASDLLKASKGEIPWYQVLEKEGFKFGRTDPELIF